MKKYYISYANDRYYRNLNNLEKTVYDKGNIDVFKKYTREWLETTEFYLKNKYILDKPRGNGYWIWKPFIILETFKFMNDGDIVMFSDAGVSVIDNLNPLYDTLTYKVNHGIMLFSNCEHRNYTWTKKDCFVLMNCDSKEYWNGQHLTATFSLWEKNKENIEFLNEWQRYLRDPRISTDDMNMFGNNLPQFKDHRHDQSVLSLMAIKYKFELYRDPSQFGLPYIDIFKNSPYKQVVNHHRGNF